VITPHNSGDSPRAGERTLALFAENLRRYKTGEPLINRVDLEAGY
jgi:D-2-hydroxyacid dehydrogenase (NADP+)